MKRIVFFISLLISIGAGAQLTPTYIGGPNSLVTSRGPFRSDSSLGNPLRDTTFKPYSVGIQVFRTADSSIYVSVSTTAARKWKKVGDAVPSTNWGSITGTLASQADLVAALAAKQNTITTGTTSQYLRGDLTLGTFSSAVTAITDVLYSPIGHSHSGLIPTGGTTGQVLTKVNSTDYNYTWSNPAAGSGTVTNIATGLWLGGGPITTTGTIQIDSANLFNQTTGALRRKDSLTSTNLKGYVTRTVLKDSMAIWRANSGILQQPTITYDVSSTYLSFPRTGLSTLTMDLIGGQPTTSSNVPYYNGSNLAWNSGLAIRASNVITSGSDTLATKAYARSVGGSGGSQTLQQVFNQQVGGSILTKSDTVLGADTYGLRLLNLGSIGLRIAGNTSNGVIVNTSSIAGSFNAPIQPLVATSSNTNTNTVEEVLRLVRQPGSAGAAGIGGKIIFQNNNTSNSLVESGRIEHVLSNATNSSYITQFNLVGASGSTEHTHMNIQDGGIVRVNNNADTLATKAYARSVGGSGSSYTDADAITAPLTGFTLPAPSTVLATDDIISAIEKLQAQIDDPVYVNEEDFEGDFTSATPLSLNPNRFKVLDLTGFEDGVIDDLYITVDGGDTVIKVREATGGTVSPIGWLYAKVGITADAPEDGDILLTNTGLIDKRIEVFLNGLLLDSSATDGYIFDDETGEITFNPGLETNDVIRVRAYDKPSIYDIALEGSDIPSYTQNFDGVTAPAFVSGWVRTSTEIQTNAPIGVPSSPNMLALVSATGSMETAAYNTVASSANLTQKLKVSFPTGTPPTVTLFARGNSTNHATNTSEYYLSISPNSGVTVAKKVGGTADHLGSGFVGTIANATLYEVTLICSGSTITGRVMRVIDGFYMNSAGTFVSGVQNVVSVTNTEVTAAGYSGIGMYTESTHIPYVDDFSITY